ncbi:MAG: ABC transporter permease, partial [Acetobacteraceae bacterium]|nr:ABC transporter permease [Acetobacteraceae bacterium]
VWYSARAELKVRNLGTYLGHLWWLLDPLMFMVVYVFLVVVVFDRGGPGYAIFVFSALVPWKWTTGCLNDSIASVRARSGLIQHIAIPKVVFPLTAVVVNTVRFAIGLGVLLVGAGLFGGRLTLATLVWLPLILLIHLAFNAGLALVLADAGVFLADIRNIMQFGLRLWFYVSPGLYAVGSFPQRYRFLLGLNPVTPLFEGYRTALLGAPPPSPGTLSWLVVFSVFCMWYGLHRMERNDSRYAKVL